MLNLTGNWTTSLASLFISDTVHLLLILTKLSIGFLCGKNLLDYFFLTGKRSNMLLLSSKASVTS